MTRQGQKGYANRIVGAPSRLMLAIAVSLGVVLSTASPASAHVFVFASPLFPDYAIVGQTFTSSLEIENTSTAPESAQYPVINVAEITLVPACPSPDPGPGCHEIAEPGVFSLIPTGTGTGPPSCAGTWTISEMRPGIFGFVPPGGEGTLQLATGETCVVTFTVTTLRVPTKDADSFGAPGVQTLQVAEVLPRAPSGPTFIHSIGWDRTTVMTWKQATTFVVEPAMFDPGQSFTVGATALSPNAPYRLKLSGKRETCPQSPIVLGGNVVTNSSGNIAPVTRVLPANATSGVRYLCWVSVADAADSSAPVQITVF